METLNYNENCWKKECPKVDCRKNKCHCGLKHIVIPADLGDDSKDSPVAPKNGNYCNSIVIYQANKHVYIYSEEGVYTLIDVDAINVAELEEEIKEALAKVEELEGSMLNCFDTVADMEASVALEEGSYAKTLGFYSVNDGGGAYYKISNVGTANGMDVISLNNFTLKAILRHGDDINVRQFGAKGDRQNNDYPSIQRAIEYAKENNITKIKMSNGEYLINSPIVLYSHMSLEGENRNNTKIFKSGHVKDSANDVDCIVTAVKAPTDTLSYPSDIEIKKISIQSNDVNDASDYGLYLYTSSHIMIDQFSSRRTKTQMYLGDMWLSSLSHIYCALGDVGIQTRNGTTLSMNDIYVDYESQYGYNIRGLSYSTFNNIACDYANNSIPYYFYYCNLVVNSLGCEATNYSQCIHVHNATVQLNSPRVWAGTTNQDQVVFFSQNSQLIINNLSVGDETQTSNYAGKLLDIVGNGSHVVFMDPKILGINNKFEQSITGTQFNTVTLIDDNDIMNLRPDSLRGYTGGQFHVEPNSFIDRVGIDRPHFQLGYPVSGNLRTLPDGTDISWANDYRPSGAIIPNMSMNKSGTMMYVKTAYDSVTSIANPITSVVTSGDNLVISFSNIELDNVPELNGFKIDNKWACRKLGEPTSWKEIDTVDYANNAITVETSSGFEVGDYVELRPPFYIRDISYTGIQGILIGTTADRPVSPSNGTMYYDTTLNKPIWRVGDNWKDSTGTNV